MFLHFYLFASVSAVMIHEGLLQASEALFKKIDHSISLPCVFTLKQPVLIDICGDTQNSKFYCST